MFSRITTTFRPALTQQLRGFAAKAAKPVVAAPKKATKVVKVEAPVKIAKTAKAAKIEEPVKMKATKAAKIEAPVKAGKASKAVKVEEPVKNAKAPKVAKAAKVEEPVKNAKAPKAKTATLAPKKASAKEAKATKAPKVAKATLKPKVEKVKLKAPKVEVVKVPKVKLPPMKRVKAPAQAKGDKAQVYLTRRDEYQEKLLKTRALMKKLVSKPNYKQETFARYEERLVRLQEKIDRTHRFFKKAQNRALKQERLAQLPSREKLSKLSHPQRLETIAKIDTNLSSGYQLFARELSILKEASFPEFLNGWKSLKEAERQVYNTAITTAKSKRVVA